MMCLMSEFRVRVGAYGVVSQQGKILLCRLGPLSNDDGWWTLPGGGMEFGEQPEETVIREMKEETGYDICVTGGPTVFSEAFPDLNMQTVCLIYQVQIVGGELSHEQQGTTDLCDWVEHSALERYPLVNLVKCAIAHVP